MIYEDFQPLNREEIEVELSSGDPKRIAGGLYSAAKYLEDWEWSQNQSLSFFNHPDMLVRWAAALSLGFIAVYQRQLDLEIVLPRLYEARADREIVGPITDALEMIAQYIPTN